MSLLEQRRTALTQGETKPLPLPSTVSSLLCEPTLTRWWLILKAGFREVVQMGASSFSVFITGKAELWETCTQVTVQETMLSRMGQPQKPTGSFLIQVPHGGQDRAGAEHCMLLARRVSTNVCMDLCTFMFQRFRNVRKQKTSTAFLCHTMSDSTFTCLLSGVTLFLSHSPLWYHFLLYSLYSFLSLQLNNQGVAEVFSHLLSSKHVLPSFSKLLPRLFPCIFLWDAPLLELWSLVFPCLWLPLIKLWSSKGLYKFTVLYSWLSVIVMNGILFKGSGLKWESVSSCCERNTGTFRI